MTRPWADLFSPQDLAVYEAYQSGLRERVQELGQRPALLVIDVTRAFCGQQGQTLADSVAAWPPSCGPAAWEAMPHIQTLIDATRRLRHTPGVAFCSLDKSDVVRHEMVQRVIDAYSDRGVDDTALDVRETPRISEVGASRRTRPVRGAESTLAEPADA